MVAEHGWGRVTTRAIADRAGLPHGTVSYHFSGKQALLVEAALQTVDGLFPTDELDSVGSLDELLRLATIWVDDGDTADSVPPAVLLEAMREAAHDAVLRQQIAGKLSGYRERVADLVRGEQQRTSHSRWHGISADTVATLIVAAGDGLWLHALLDPQLDAADAAAALRSLLSERLGEQQ